MHIILTRDCQFMSAVKQGLHTVPKGYQARTLGPGELRTMPRTYENQRIRSEFKRHKERGDKGCFAWIGGKWRWLDQKSYRQL